MKPLFTANIMRTAIFVALLAILPAMVINAVSVFSRYWEEVRAADERGERFVRFIALRQEQMTEVLETLLRTLERLREVRQVDTDAASALFRTLVANSPEYTNIFLLNNSGDILASALPDQEHNNFSGDLFLEKTLSNGAFSVSGVKTSLFSKEQTLYFAVPVNLENSEHPGVVAVALNLARFDELFTEFPLTEGASVYLLDGSGKLVAAYPQSGSVPPGKFLEDRLWSAVKKLPEISGQIAYSGEDNSSGKVTFRKLVIPGSDSPYFYILYTQPSHAAYAHARLALDRDIAVFVVIAFLSLATAVGLSFFAVRRPWQALLDAASHVGHGEFDMRVPEKGVRGEIGVLCREFNAMAEALDRRDKELSAARDQAEQSRVSKGEFLANMSHEIRTSMNAILGMAYLVMKTDLTVQQRGYISKLLTAAKSLLRVINDILDFSKMEAGKMAMENISFSLRRILASVRSESASRLAEKKLGFELQISRDIPDYLVGDPLRLSQALTMLVDDAVNRSERGIVSLACSVLEQDTDQVKLQFVIRDAGVGLTPSQLMEMKELFGRDEEEGPTTLDKLRLRLAIANRLFRMMRGSVNISSIFGGGTVFTALARFGYMDGGMWQPEKVFAGKRALVIDGSEISRQELLEVLHLFGFGVECVNSVDAALVVLREGQEKGESFAVIFLDWRPSATDMAGQIFRLRGASSSSLPLVLTTSSGRTDLSVSLEELNIDALLPKPINESLVFDTLVNLLDVQENMALFSSEESRADEKFKGLKVLLVEDNAVNQQIAEKILENEKVVLTVAENGKEAVRAVTESPPGTFDLVLMDLQMPVMGGFEAARAIRSHAAFHLLRLPIIAMTAHSDEAKIVSCSDVGMNGHTSKPIVIDKFFGTISQWLPVDMSAAAVLEETVTQLRDCDDETEREALLQKILPVLHEGRISWIRAAFAEGNDATVTEMFEALAAITRVAPAESEAHDAS